MRKRSFITGCAGFIGSHLAERLLEAGHEVVGLDDLSTGSARNVVDLLSHPRFRFVRGSILDRDLVDQLAAQSDRIFHFAAAVGVHTIVNDPVESLRTNLSGTECVLDAALRHDSRVLIASTSEVYGKNDGQALDEGADRIMGSALKSRWSYAAAKALDEMIAHTYWRTRGLRAVIVRPFNTVGPRQTGRYGMVVPRFVEQALAGNAITVCGDGQQSRCFLHVGDLVSVLVELLEHPPAWGEVFNVGGEEEITINDLASMVVRLTGSSSPIVHLTQEQLYGEGFEDMRRRVPNTTKVRSHVEFAQSLSIEQIVRTVIDDRRTNAMMTTLRSPSVVNAPNGVDALNGANEPYGANGNNGDNGHNERELVLSTPISAVPESLVAEPADGRDGDCQEGNT